MLNMTRMKVLVVCTMYTIVIQCMYTSVQYYSTNIAQARRLLSGLKQSSPCTCDFPTDAVIKHYEYLGGG